MAELWGAIQQGFGSALNAIYSFIPSYGVAIILLTVAVRLLLFPLTVKQIRSMTAMSKLQPQLKEIQQKFKGDRQKMNEELMKLYKEHGVNPLGGCLPLIAQMPVFIALFTVLRASIPIGVATAVTPATGEPIPASTYATEELPSTFCRPTGETNLRGTDTLHVIECVGEENGQKEFEIGGFEVPRTEEEVSADLISVCQPVLADGGDTLGFSCRSALGTGHLPTDSELFEDITADKASFLGMRLACSAPQIGSKTAARQCTASDDVGGIGNQMPYYILIALIVGTAFYQAHQMAKRAKGPAAQQQKMMSRVMPIFFGFISLSLPAGTNVYFLATNAWTIGQQAIVLKRQDQAEGAVKPEKKRTSEPEPPKPDRTQPVKGQSPKKGKPTPKRKRR